MEFLCYNCIDMEEKIIIRFRDLTLKSHREKLINDEENLEDYLLGVQPGRSVKHHNFGRGIIKTIEDSKIQVEFKDKDRLFSYPSSFLEGYLTIDE